MASRITDSELVTLRDALTSTSLGGPSRDAVMGYAMELLACLDAERAESTSLTAQLDAVTSTCGGCKGSGFTPARFNSVVSQKCNDCKGTGRVLRCQGRLDAAEACAHELNAHIQYDDMRCLDCERKLRKRNKYFHMFGHHPCE